MNEQRSDDSGRLQPHEFKPRRDPGLAAFAAGSGAAGAPSGAVPPAVVTGHYIRESLCYETGCNRPELDPVHEAPEE